jgi:hypothetical protein
VTSVSALIAPALDAYVELISFDFDDKPYVFCAARDPNRCLTSSAWSAYCKVIFKKWSGIACPCVLALSFAAHYRIAVYSAVVRASCSPKMLRASFVTWVRNSEASPEILKQVRPPLHLCFNHHSAMLTAHRFRSCRRRGQCGIRKSEQCAPC